MSLPAPSDFQRIWPFKALIFAAIFAPLVFFAVGAWQSHRELYAQAEDRVHHQVAFLDEHADKVLESLQLVIQQVNQRVQGLSWDEIRTSRPLWEELRRLAYDIPQVDAIFIVDPQGINALTTRVFPAPPLDFSTRDYFTVQRDEDAGTYLGGTYTGKISRHTIFNLSQRRTGPAPGFDGVIGVSASGYLETFYASIAPLHESITIALTRSDGQILARYPATATLPVTAAGPALVERAGEDKEGLFYTEAQDDGSRRIVGFERLKDYPAFVSFSLDDRAVRSAWYASLVHWGVLALAAAVSLFLMAWIALRRTQRAAVAVKAWRQTSDDLVEETERRKLAETALAQTRKLEALGQLTGGVAHDFNNLLQILSGQLSLLEPAIADERSKKRLLASRRTIERGEKLVQQLLAFARRQPLRFEVFDAGERLLALAPLLRQSVAGAVLSIDAPPELWPVEADANQLDLAVMNLVFNARDALPSKDGMIEITAHNRSFTDGDSSDLIGDFVAIAVRDNGVGMSEDLLTRVWEPFFTTKPAGKGTGLGLSMVYGFARQSGGSVAIDSKSGAGTTVTLYLRKGISVQVGSDGTDTRPSETGNPASAA